MHADLGVPVCARFLGSTQELWTGAVRDRVLSFARPSMRRVIRRWPDIDTLTWSRSGFSTRCILFPRHGRPIPLSSVATGLAREF